MAKKPESTRLYYYHLGKITAEFSSLEWLLLDCLYLMATTFDDTRLSFDARVKLLIVGEDFTVLLRKLDTMMGYCVTQRRMLVEYHAFSERLRKLNKRRNDYVHTSSWGLKGSPRALRYKESRKENKWGDLTARIPVTLEELERFVQEIEDLYTDVNNWFLDNDQKLRTQFAAKVKRNRQAYERRRGHISKFSGEELPPLEWPPLSFDSDSE